jgi:hypothetical protein
MEQSQEYHAVVVQDLYLRVLGRFPDSSGMATWVDFLNLHTAEQLEANLLGSDEYFTKFGGGNNTGFLQAVYQLVLQRPIDPSGAQSWGQELANGRGRTDVAAAILASLESDRLETQTMYANFLHRQPDPGGFDNFTDLLQQGLPNESVIAVILSSEEYFGQI